MRSVFALGVSLAVGLAASTASAAPVDLSSWNQDGAGSWNLQSGNNAVLQTSNSDPGFFHNNSSSSQGLALSGTIKVQTTTDDDFIGFVLGYHDGDNANASANYILIDWKQGNQALLGCDGVTNGGSAGLAISRVTGVMGHHAGAWCHNPANGVTELARATNLGSTGWSDNVEYTFDLVFLPNLIQVKVDGVVEISLAGVFEDGGFGFYNYSQEQVLYAGIEEEKAPADLIPAPAGVLLMGPVLAIAGMALRRKQ